MSRQRTKIISPDGEEVERLLHTVTDTREHERLVVARMAMSGEHTLAMMAEAVGRTPACVSMWLRTFREGGVEALLRRTPPPGGTPALGFEEQAQVMAGLAEGAWRTAKEFQAWLERAHHIKIGLKGCYYWLGKSRGRLKAPRPVHAKQAAGAVTDFKMSGWEDRLGSLDIPLGAPVRFWVMDEARFGLRTAVRRCWSLRGTRVVKPARQCFEWEYIQAAVDVLSGEPVFCYMPTVSAQTTGSFLREIVKTDPEAHHVVLWDGAGFHQPSDSPALARVHTLKLPPYCPELNPVEKVWDQLRDAVCNRVFKSIRELRRGLLPKLREFWTRPEGLRSLIGNNWLRQKIIRHLAGHFSSF